MKKEEKLQIQHHKKTWVPLITVFLVFIFFIAIFLNYRAAVGKAILVGTEEFTPQSGSTIDLSHNGTIIFTPPLPDEKGVVLTITGKTDNGKSEEGVNYAYLFKLFKVGENRYSFQIATQQEPQSYFLLDTLMPGETTPVYLDLNNAPDLTVSFLNGQNISVRAFNATTIPITLPSQPSGPGTGGNGTGGGTPFSFTLSSEGKKVVAQNSSITNVIAATIVAGATPQAINFNLQGLPPATTFSFTPSSCSPSCSSLLTITTTSSTPNGTFPVTVQAQGGNITRTTAFDLIVNISLTPPSSPAGFDFSLSNDGDKSVTNGSSVISTLTTTLTSGNGQLVNFSGSNLPAGIIASFAPQNCTIPCSTNATLAAAGSAALGEHKIMLNATAAGITKSTKFDLRVYAPLNFTLSHGGDKSAAAGTAINNTVNVQLSAGTPQTITFSSSGLPSGTSASFTPTSCLPPCSTTLSFTPGILAAAGAYNVTVTASGAGITQKTAFTLLLTTAAKTCEYNWLCGDWSLCQNNLQSRSCNRIDQCDKLAGTTTKIDPLPKPETQRICQAPPPPVTPPTPPPQLCSPTAKQCSGNQLQQCGYDGKSWTTLDVCSAGCNPVTLQCEEKLPLKKQLPFPPWIWYLIGSLVVVAVIGVIILSLLGQKKYAPAKEYIEEGRARGLSREQLRQRLVSQGWSPRKVDKLLK